MKEVDRYNRDKVYTIGEAVKASNGKIYISTQNENVANVPLDNSTFWTKVNVTQNQ